MTRRGLFHVLTAWLVAWRLPRATERVTGDQDTEPISYLQGSYRYTWDDRVRVWRVEDVRSMRA